MDSAERQQIAARIRGLFTAQDWDDFAALARRLHVDQTSLHMSIDESAPYPTIDVIAAVIRSYGVDPMWLLTGEYDSSTHRSSLDTTTEEMPAIISGLVSRTFNDGMPLQ
jgi:hypothetical protein